MLVDGDGDGDDVDVDSDADAGAGLDSVSIASSLDLSYPILSYPFLPINDLLSFDEFRICFSPCNCKWMNALIMWFRWLLEGVLTHQQ